VLVSPSIPDTVGWYLRDTPKVTVGETAKSSTVIIVLPLEAGSPLGYVGERYRLDTSVALRFGSWKELWRWYAYREAPSPVIPSDAMVYVRPIG